MAFDPPVFDAQGCTRVNATEYAGKWLFNSVTNQQGGVIKTYWLGRNYDPFAIPQPNPLPPVENNYVGINTAEPTSVLDVHIPENIEADPKYGLSVSTGLGCSKVGLVAGDDKPSWVGSYSFDENAHHPFQVRAGNYGAFWNPSLGTYIHLNPSNERIGINTATPAATLDVNGDAKADNLKLTQVPEGLVGINGTGMISPATPTQVMDVIGPDRTTNYIPRFSNTGTFMNSDLFNAASGKIGLGTANPMAKLHLKGLTNSPITYLGNTENELIRLSNQWNGTNTDVALTFDNGEIYPSSNVAWKMTAGVAGSNRFRIRNVITTENAGEPSYNEKYLISMDGNTGNTGLGTEPNSTHRLLVNGKVKADEVNVTGSVTGNAIVTLDAAADKQKAILIQDNGTTKWQIAKEANSDDLVIGDGSAQIRVSQSETQIATNLKANATLEVGGTSTLSGDVSAIGKLNVGGITTITNLSGSGNRMVICDANGKLSHQAIPVMTGGNDNLGNHTATQNLNMANKLISGVNGIGFSGGISVSGGNTYLRLNGGPFSIGSIPPFGKVFNASGNSSIENGGLQIGNLGSLGNYGNVTGELAISSEAYKPGSGSWSILSDKRLKERIEPFHDGLSKLLQINPVSYQYKKGVVVDPSKRYVGIIAQEINEIFPYTIEKRLSKYDGLPENEYFVYNSSALTYVIINSIKELKQEIDSLKNVISSGQNLKTAISEVPENLMLKEGIELSQNIPNPSDNSTRIDFKLPEGINQAYISVYDLNGRELKRVEINHSGMGSETLYKKDFGTGVFIYTLYANGAVPVSKSLIFN